MTPTRVRTTCTFCRFGCELEIVRQGRRIVGVEYPEDSAINGGRLCARGSASALLLDHPMRLCYPLKDGKERTWEEFFAEVGPAFRDCPSNELAITYDRNLTQEELELVFGLANALGTDNIASSWLEAEALFQLRLDTKPKVRARPWEVTREDIARADTILLVGDVFGVMPVMAQPILAARYADRNRRLFYLDSVKTRAAGFAHRFLWVRPGTEAIAALGLAAQLDPRLSGFDPSSVAACCGINPEVLSEVAAGFDKSRRGVIVAALQSGRVMNPDLLAGALQVLVARMKGNKKLLPVGEFETVPGKRSFGEILADVQNGSVKVMVNFGERFPFEYPMLEETLRKLELFVATAWLRPPDIGPRAALPGWTLPVPLDLEKEGTVRTLWGNATLSATADPASGSKTIAEIVSGLIGQVPMREELPITPPAPAIPTKLITDRARQILKAGAAPAEGEDYPFVLLAEKPAYGFRGIFRAEATRREATRREATRRDAGFVAMSPEDLRARELPDHGLVRLETMSGKKAVLRTRRSEQVARGTLLVDVNDRVAWTLFDLEIDKGNGMAIIPPTRVKLWRNE
jgi:anaerobic selenocysteine-containing dehydrogenase